MLNNLSCLSNLSGLALLELIVGQDVIEYVLSKCNCSDVAICIITPLPSDLAVLLDIIEKVGTHHFRFL